MIAMPQSMTASRLRLILSITLVLFIIAGGVIFYFAYSELSKTAAETGEQAASATQSESTIERLEQLKAELEAKKDVVTMISDVTADSQNYYYQDRLVNDLTAYAARANLSITNISFAASQAAATTPAPSAPATTEGADGGSTMVAPGQTPEGTTSTAPPASSLRKATVDITLNNPVNYRDLLNFLHYIEQNLTKLKVSTVSMTSSGGEEVTIDVLNLEVYIR